MRFGLHIVGRTAIPWWADAVMVDDADQCVSRSVEDPRSLLTWRVRTLRCAIVAHACYHQHCCDIIGGVKQLLLRVPEDIHRRLVARAAREGRSLNAVATEILDTAADADSGDRRAQLRAAAAAAGTLRRVNARSVSADRRRRIIESTRGLGPQIDQLLAQERERP